MRITLERLADDGTAPELLYQVVARRRPADGDDRPVDVRLSRRGSTFTSTALADWEGPALRRETDTLGVLVTHTDRHPLTTALEALRVLARRAHRSS